MIVGQGLLVMIAGALETGSGFPDVPVQVRAVTSPVEPASFDAAEWSPPRDDAPIRIVARANELEVGLTPRSHEDVAAIVESVHSWNIEHGFYHEEETTQEARAAKSSWILWLENVIVRYFGPDERIEAPASIAGDVAVAHFALTGPVAHGETVEVVFERDSGDASFQVIEGSRFSITESNWDRPFAAVIQVDHRVDEPIAATFRARSGNFFFAWMSTFYLAAGIFVALCAYHAYALPRPLSDRSEAGRARSWWIDFAAAFVTFFEKRHIVITIAFLLIYRFAEAQLVKLASPFLLDLQERGGLSLSTGEVGFVYGTVGVTLLVFGGILGGWLAARNGLRFWIGWMALAINLPNLTYVFLSYARPESFLVVNAAIAIEQFGYGFGFAGYMLYMLYAARGNHETSHYAICTGFMALGMMLPGMMSGWLEDLIGYQHFFVWVMLATIPSFLVTALVYSHIDPNFGRREDAA
jgi:PAT family beta-lactamase induction signal transducer AmpG